MAASNAWLAMTEAFAQLPQTTAMDWISLDAIRHEALRAGAAYWGRLRGERPWPSREELNLREMASFVRFMSLVRVIDDGADFEHRIVGDAMAQLFTVPIQNKRFSEIAKTAPVLIEKAAFSLRKVLATRSPLALRERGSDSDLLLEPAELIILPLGRSADVIDHMLCFAFRGARVARADRHGAPGA